MATVISFPISAEWTASERAAIESARKALEAREALKAPRARRPVGVTYGEADDGATWASLTVGDEDSPAFSVSVHKAPGRVALLAEDGDALAVGRTVADVLRDGIGMDA